MWNGQRVHEAGTKTDEWIGTRMDGHASLGLAHVHAGWRLTGWERGSWHGGCIREWGL